MRASTLHTVLFLLSALVLLSSSEDYKPINYKKCGSKFEIINVEATNCPGDFLYCPFKKGSVPKIRITFKPERDVKALKTIVRAEIGASYFFHSLDNDNPCKGSNLTCPLQAGKTYYYTDSVEIKESYPATNVRVRWIFTNPDNDDSNDASKRDLCIMFLAKVHE